MNILKKKPDHGRKDLAKAEMKRYESLRSERMQVFDSAWQTVYGYFLPNLSDINEEKTEDSTGWADRIYDTTGIEDARTCTTGQSNWATPSTEPWFQWAPPEEMNIEDGDDGAIWCGICTDIALKELARSNYYRVSGAQYKSRTVAGTGHMHIEEGKESMINCRSRKVGTYCIANNSDGLVDTVYAEFKFSARQAAQEWGPENLSPKVLKALEDNKGGQMDKKFRFLHVIRPRDEQERIPGKIDAENKPFASIYISMEDEFCVKISGYDEMPDSVTRFDDWGTDTPWGYSPAFESLPNARELNYMVRFMDSQYELRANPRILAPTTAFGQMDLRPGGITPYDPNLGELGMPREWMTQADIGSTDHATEIKRNAMHRLFYTDVFKALAQMQQVYKTPPTAFQIQQVLGENLEQLSPMFGRLITEKCGPDLKRVFGILFRANKFPKPPRSMYVPDPTGKKIRLAMPEVIYTSRLALALKARQNKATMDTLSFVTEFSQTNNRPDILDNWDVDAMMRAFWINQGASARFERKMKDVVKMRAARAQQQQQQRAMDMAEQAANAAGKLGKAPQKLQDAVSDQIPGAQ